ncbi:MAG TPA: hypothetical protein EYH56_00855 [Nanoarchaeota archaeon]|nr:hypothetical protein [Nanoarchaeota archaeon]
MEIYCEKFVKYYLSAIRAIIAKLLLEKYDLTQNEVAKKMKTTQPAISHYIREVRGKKVKEIENNEVVIKKINEFVEMLYNKELSEEEFQKFFCEICKLILGDKTC